jgi:hypothetical protein
MNAIPASIRSFAEFKKEFKPDGFHPGPLEEDLPMWAAAHTWRVFGYVPKEPAYQRMEVLLVPLTDDSYHRAEKSMTPLGFVHTRRVPRYRLEVRDELRNLAIDAGMPWSFLDLHSDTHDDDFSPDYHPDIVKWTMMTAFGDDPGYAAAVVDDVQELVGRTRRSMSETVSRRRDLVK